MVRLLADRVDRALRTLAAGAVSQRVLDVGCGEQPLRATLESLGYAYYSLDVEQNRRHTVDVVAKIDEPFESQVDRLGLFDLVVCTEVLEHVADWSTAFSNIRSLLVPGGRALVSCPHVYPLHEAPFDFWRPTPFAIRHFAGKAGLSVVAEESAGDGLDVLGTVLACAEPVARSGGLTGRLAAAASNVGRKAAFVLLRSTAFRRLVAVRGMLYLSNIAILERPAEV